VLVVAGALRVILDDRFIFGLWCALRQAFPKNAETFVHPSGLLIKWLAPDGRHSADGFARPVSIVVEHRLAEAIRKTDDSGLVPIIQAAQQFVLAAMTAYMDAAGSAEFSISLDSSVLVAFAAFGLGLPGQAAARPLPSSSSRPDSNAEGVET
jgi:hypothetical protein